MAIATTTALALAAAAAAAGTSYYNTTQTAKKADNVAAEGIRTQAANQRKANARVGQTIEQIGGSDASAAKKTAGKQYLDAVQARMGQANRGLTRAGLSADFNERAGGAVAANEDYGKVTADLMARMDAPVLQRQHEGDVVGNTGMDLSALGSKIQGDAFLNQIAMGGVRRNPFLDAASAALNGYASAGGSLGTTAAPAGTSTAAAAAPVRRVGTGPY